MLNEFLYKCNDALKHNIWKLCTIAQKKGLLVKNTDCAGTFVK